MIAAEPIVKPAAVTVPEAVNALVPKVVVELSLSASSAVKTTFPDAAPGDAGRPFAITFFFYFFI